MAGKGDRPRNLGPEFRKNYDQIEWRKKGTYCYDCGRDLTDIPADKRQYYPDGDATCTLKGDCGWN